MIMKIGDVHPIIGMEVHWAWNLKRILNYLTCSLCYTHHYNYFHLVSEKPCLSEWQTAPYTTEPKSLGRCWHWVANQSWSRFKRLLCWSWKQNMPLQLLTSSEFIQGLKAKLLRFQFFPNHNLKLRPDFSSSCYYIFCFFMFSFIEIHFETPW